MEERGGWREGEGEREAGGREDGRLGWHLLRRHLLECLFLG